MARPKEFDRDAALERAMMVFWEKGYASTSTADLVSAMGIGRQSLYDTFGDKRALYLEALARYSDASVTDLLGHLKAERPLDAIAAMLYAFAARPVEQNALGCMGINSICELGRADGEVSAVHEVHGERLKNAIVKLLQQAKKDGSARATLNPHAGADFILSTLAGMKVSAKAGAGAATLHAIAQLAVQGLKA